MNFIRLLLFITLFLNLVLVYSFFFDLESIRRSSSLRIGLSLILLLSSVQLIFTFGLMLGLKSISLVFFYIASIWTAFLWAYKKDSIHLDRYLVNLKFFINLIFLILVSFIGSYSLIFYGDGSWDSNAYHHKQTAYLFTEGFWGWLKDVDLTNGYHVFFPPGITTLNLVPTFLMNSISAGGITNSIFFIALCFIFQGLVQKVFLKLIIPFILLGVPSIFGELGNGYVDLGVGAYILSAIVAISASKSVILNSNYDFNSFGKLSFLFIIFTGSAVMSKIQVLLPLSLLFIFYFSQLLYSSYQPMKMFIKSKSVYFLAILIAGSVSLSSYLRNIIVFRNPLYPFTFGPFEGKILISDIQDNLDNFWWPMHWRPGFISGLLNSYILSPVRISFDQFQNLLGKELNFNLEFDRSFIFDSPVGGIGIVFPILILFALIHLYVYGKSTVVSHDLFSLKFFGISSLLVLMSTTANWMPRYALGGSLSLLLVMLIYIDLNFNKFNLKALFYSALLIGVCANLFGNYKHQFTWNLDSLKKNHETNRIFPMFGIASNNKKLEDIVYSCPLVIIDRPTKSFTSWIYSDFDCNVKPIFVDLKKLSKSDSGYFKSESRILLLSNIPRNEILLEFTNLAISNSKFDEIIITPYWDSGNSYFPYVFDIVN